MNNISQVININVLCTHFFYCEIIGFFKNSIKAYVKACNALRVIKQLAALHNNVKFFASKRKITILDLLN